MLSLSYLPEAESTNKEWLSLPAHPGLWECQNTSGFSRYRAQRKEPETFWWEMYTLLMAFQLHSQAEKGEGVCAKTGKNLVWGKQYKVTLRGSVFNVAP